MRGTPLNEVKEVVIHKLIKERQGSATFVTRPTLLPLSEPVSKLVHDIHALYAEKPGKGYGRFEPDETNYPASRILRSTFKDSAKSFLETSKDLMSVLSTKANQAALATGGYVLMAHVTNAAMHNWFIVAIITHVRGSAINDESLEVVDTVHVDLQNLRVAGRVNITEWLAGAADARYIGFLKQRGEVSDYFKLFLGCNELIASTEETKKLVSILKSVSKELALDAAAQEQFLRRAYDHCEERRKNDEPLSLDVLANAVWPQDPKTIQTALATSNVQITDGFVPDGRILKAFVKIRAKTSFWSIDFERAALVNGQIKYDPDKRTLTLRDLPADLEAELKNELGDGSI